MFTKHVVKKDGVQIKIYVNADNSQAVIFTAFGRYFKLSSDVNVLDFATTFLLAKPNNVVSFESYQSSLEGTALIKVVA